MDRPLPVGDGLGRVLEISTLERVDSDANFSLIRAAR